MQKGSGGGGFWGVLGRSRVARLFGAPATALRCDRLAGVPRRLQKPTRSFAQLTLATLPIEEDEEMEEMEEMEGDVEAGRGVPVSPSASSLVSSVSVSELGDGDGEESETKAAEAAAEEEGAAAASGSKQEEGLQPPGGGPAPLSSRWQRVGRALRPRKLKEKLLSFVVGVVHGVGGVSGQWAAGFGFGCRVVGGVLICGMMRQALALLALYKSYVRTPIQLTPPTPQPPNNLNNPTHTARRNPRRPARRPAARRPKSLGLPPDVLRRLRTDHGRLRGRLRGGHAPAGPAGPKPRVWPARLLGPVVRGGGRAVDLAVGDGADGGGAGGVERGERTRQP